MVIRKTSAAPLHKPRARRTTRRRRGRRGSVGASGASSLSSLAANLQEMKQRVAAVGDPLHAVRNLLATVRKPLAFPGELAKHLKSLREIVVGVKTIATGLSWLPGPIGTGATALERAAKPLVEGPPPPGSIAKLQKSVERVDTSLKPARDALDKMKTPLDKACGAVDAISGKLVFLENIVDGLVQRYGDHPPAEIESCATRLNTPVAAMLAAMRKVEDALRNPLDVAKSALSQVEQILKPVGQAISALSSALKALDSAAMRKIRSLLNRLVKAVEPYIRKIKIIVQKALNDALKKLGIDARKVEAYLDKLAQRLDPTKPIRQTIDRIQGRVGTLASELARSLGIGALLAQIESLREQLEREVEAFLASACGRVLAPAASTRPALTTRRPRRKRSR